MRGGPGPLAASAAALAALAVAVAVVAGAPQQAAQSGFGPAYVPAGDDDVVERLPARLAGQALRAWREARSSPAEDTDRLALAERLLADGRRDGDPRLLGRAHALLAPLRDAAPSGFDAGGGTGTGPASSVRGLLLLATVLQAQHDFPGALAVLDRVLQSAPDEPQAWLTRTSIEQLQGRIDDARASCARVRATSRSIAGAVCAADIASLHGDPDAYRRLERAALVARSGIGVAETEETLRWVSGVLAELAEREGRDTEAERHHVDAMRGTPAVYPRAAFADFLLARGRIDQAIAVLGAAEPLADVPETLLLRHAIALRARGAAGDRDMAERITVSLRARQVAAEARGDRAHAREAARLALDVEHDPASAVRWALIDWSVQREPADALLLARAAQAAGDRRAMATLDEYLRETGLRDARIERARGAR